MGSRFSIYVATDGDDGNPGTQDQPLATPFGAGVAARKLREKDKDAEVTIGFDEGIYHFPTTLVLSIEDSPSQTGSLTFQGDKSGNTTFRGSVPLTGWVPFNGDPDQLRPELRKSVWSAPLPPEVNVKTANALFRDGLMLPRARGTEFVPDPDSETVPESERLQSIRYPEGAIEQWEDLKSAELVVIPNRAWTMHILPIARIDPVQHVAFTTAPHTYPMLPSAPAKGPIRNAAAWVENTLSVLTEPGEWVLDKERNMIHLLSDDGVPGDDIEVGAVTEIMRVEGGVDYDATADRAIHNVAFERIKFENAARFAWQGQTGWGVQHDWEAFDRPTAMLRLRGAEGCSITGCRFTESAGAAIRLDLHCQKNLIKYNRINNVGGCGIFLCGYGPGTKDVNKHNVVHGNLIKNVGTITWHSPAVFVWQSGENEITRNEISETPYTAVVVSGRIQWDRSGVRECSRTVRWNECALVVGRSYKKPLWYEAWYADWKRREPLYHARGNILEGNEITHVMKVLGDGNGIYVSGCGGGNVLRGNSIHDCPGPLMYEAIRCDDDQHGTLIEGNLIYKIGGAAIGIANKGVNDIVGNIIATPLSDKTHRSMISLEMGMLYGAKVQKNIIYATKTGQELYYNGPPLHGDGPWPTLSDCDADGNLYWCVEDPSACEKHLSAARTVGIELTSRTADPLFGDPSKGDFRLGPNSPAHELGIAEIDTHLIGLPGDFPEHLSS